MLSCEELVSELLLQRFLKVQPCVPYRRLQQARRVTVKDQVTCDLMIIHDKLIIESVIVIISHFRTYRLIDDTEI